MTSYRVKGLDPAPFKPLFGLSDEELSKRGIVRMCRVSIAGVAEERITGMSSNLPRITATSRAWY